MSILDKKGINVTSGFKLISGQPIDTRMVVDDETELQSIIDNGGAYEGQLVYVKSTKKYMKHNGTEYEELATGGGTSQVFVDVDSLPTENIDSGVIYRLFRVYGYFNGTPQTNTTVYIVDSLPTTGENCTVDGSTFTNMYYNTTDESVYGYVDATIGAAFGVTAGWYPASSLLQIASMTYGGIVDSIVGLEEGTYYFIREYDFYVYKSKWIKLDNDIVFQGEGESSIIMNDLSNVASGDKSIAEGSGTTASGNYSHAEGYATTASGNYSHAEGNSTTASSTASHAEGSDTTASGAASHAEGSSTTASGMCSHAEGIYYTAASGTASHAEGEYTIAASSYQHVQGRYNIEDSSETYAHIVGNGSSSARSNAHTLDWSGNAWYQGDIKTGGTTYDDAPNTVVTSLGTPTDSGQILIGNTDGTAEWSTETLSELSQRITDLESSGGGGGSSVFSPYIIEISVEDASTGLYSRDATTEEIEQITNNPFNVVIKYTETALGTSSYYLYHNLSDTTTQQIGYYTYSINTDGSTTYIDNIIVALQSGSLLIAIRQRITL